MLLTRLPLVLGLLLVLAPGPALATVDKDLTATPCAAGRPDPPNPPAQVPAVDPALTGQPWRLTELLAEPLPAEEAAPYLLFTNGGDLVGFGGCNYFLGRYRIDEAGKLLVSSLKASHHQCPKAAEREPTLLTSLLLANGLQVSEQRLTFLMNGNNLMQLGAAPEISTEDLTRQGKLLKVKKTRKQKAKKKKAPGKVKKGAKKTVAKATTPKPRAATQPAKKK
jgi:heat shock protein HslJ